MCAMSTEQETLEQGTRTIHVGRALALIVLWTLLTMSGQAVARPPCSGCAPWGGVAYALMGALQWTLSDTH